jgi:hypothetical protein
MEWLVNNKDYLLVFENAEELSDLDGLWPDAAGSVLITARGHSFNVLAGDSLDLVCLQPTDGGQFLSGLVQSLNRNYIPNDKDTESSEDISEKFGGHPLALAHMASWICETNTPLTEFLGVYDKASYEINLEYEASGLKFRSKYEKSYAECWALSFSRLKDRPAARLAGILALLDSDVPPKLFEEYSESSHDDIEPLINIGKFLNAKLDLRRHALIRDDPELGVISTHRLIQEASIRYLNNTNKIEEAFNDATNCLSLVYPRQKQGSDMIEFHPVCKLWTPSS